MEQKNAKMHTDIPTHIAHCYPTRRICWSALFTGALIAVGLSILLNLFAVAIGVHLLTTDSDTLTGLALGGFLAILFGVIVTMVTAGYAAGYLGRPYSPLRNLGILYGFVTWCLAFIISAAMAMHLGEYFNTSAHMFINVKQMNSPEMSQKASNATTDAAAEVANKATENAQKLSAEVTPSKALTTLGYAVFVLFFLGALSSCAGACWGMSCKRED